MEHFHECCGLFFLTYLLFMFYAKFLNSLFTENVNEWLHSHAKQGISTLLLLCRLEVDSLVWLLLSHQVKTMQ